MVATEAHSTSIPPNVILGVTHLSVDGKLVRFLQCPFCNFRNINQDTITHHIQYTNDFKHDIDLNQLDKSRYIVTRTLTKSESPYGPYLSKESLPSPWIKCLWCNYKDKLEFDLSLHMLEKHGAGKYADGKLFLIPISSNDRKRTKVLSGDKFARFEGAIEFRLDVAVEMAKEENRNKGVSHAIKSIQKRMLQRRAARDRED